MYKDKLICSLKVGKNILREDKDTVLLPFGCEYSIYMKNLEARTVVVSVSLDGVDVLEGNQLVIHPLNTVELEGFIKDHKVDGKFKFIQKTKQIQKHRGDKIDDGILRISFNYVMPILPRYCPSPIMYANNYYYKTLSSTTLDNSGVLPTTTYAVGEFNPGQHTNSTKSSNSRGISGCSAGGQSVSNFNVAPLADEGITVKGSDSSQSFSTTTVGNLEEETHVIVMKLMGINPVTEVMIKQPITTNTKRVCSSCGKSNKSHMKYCGQCGTRLE